MNERSFTRQAHRYGWCERIPDNIILNRIRGDSFDSVGTVCHVFQSKGPDYEVKCLDCRFYKGKPEIVMKFKILLEE